MSARALAVLACASVAVAVPPRVALYVGAGSAPTSRGNFTDSLTNLAATGVIAKLTLLTTAAEVAALSRDTQDIVVFPGGGGSSEAAGIGAAGAAAVKSFVSSGGGYYGTCAGGFLASAATCCDVPTPGYCGGKTGCSPSSYGLGLIPLGAAEPWDRGHGIVTVAFSDATIATLKLDASKYQGKNVSVLYFQGPIADKMYPKNFTTGAIFMSEIHTGHTQYTTGQMLDAPALMMTTYGAGRVLISPPHPEESVPRYDDLVEAYTLWAANAL